MLPFTREQFDNVFVAYNHAIWPLQVVAYALGALAVVLLFRRGRQSGRIVSGILATMWAWTGVAYHGLFFAPINPAAFAFAAVFLVEAVALAIVGVSLEKLRFGNPKRSVASWTGAVFIAYAALVYPLIGMANGRSYDELPMFGVTPCPVTIFTFGVFLLAAQPVSRWLLVIPFAWSLIGGSAAIVLAVPQDWVLLVSGLIAIPLVVHRDRSRVSATGTI